MDIFQFELCCPLATAEIATPIEVLNPEKNGAHIKHCTAIWDTGATSSMISQGIARKLNLQPDGKTRISGVHGIEDAAVYHVDLRFNNGFTIPDVRVSEASDNGGFDVLVGMDIICRGELRICGWQQQHLQVCFQMPLGEFSRSYSAS
jgi:hypothetical protein